MLVIWIGLLFGIFLQICSCGTNEISWSTQKIAPSLEEKANISSNFSQNLEISDIRTEKLVSLQQLEENAKNVENSLNENNTLDKSDVKQVDSTLVENQNIVENTLNVEPINGITLGENQNFVKNSSNVEPINGNTLGGNQNLMKNPSNENITKLVKRNIEQVDGYSTFGGNQGSDFNPYKFGGRGENLDGGTGYDKDLGEGIFQKNLGDSALDENNGGERLTSNFASFYQPAGRSYLGELSHKVTKLFGGEESPDYYERPFGSENGFSKFRRHEENLNNALTFRDIVEGNQQAAIRKDMNSAGSDLSSNFQEKRSSNDYNDDDSWLMSSMASDKSIVDDDQSSNIISNDEEYLAENKGSMLNNVINDRRSRQTQERPTEKNEQSVDKQDKGSQGDVNTINAESGESILQESGNLIENPNPSSRFQQNYVMKVGDTLNASLPTLQGNSGELSQVSGSNNRKREVNILEDGSADEECEIIDGDILKLDETRMKDSKVSEAFDTNQNVSLHDSQNSAEDLLSSNDGVLGQKSVSDENLDPDSKPTNKHKRNEVHKFKKKMKGLIKKTLENVLPLKMDDSLSEQSQPIPSIDNGGGILLKDLDFKNDEKIPDTNENNNSKSSSTSVNDYRNKDKNLVLNEQGPKLNDLKDSVGTEADVSSSNNVNDAKFIQDPSGESIMESIDGVKTLKLSSVNFKADDSESNFVSDQSGMDKKLVKKQKTHNAASRHPMRLSHKNRHKKLNSARGKIVSSYNRNGFLKTTSPSSALNSEGNSGGSFSSKLFIHGKKSPLKNKQPSNNIKKGLKGKEEKLDGFYPYETTTKAMKLHNIKKNDNKNRTGIAGKKMVKVKLSVSPCQFNRDKYLIKNKSASKANAPKILSSRSVKQDVKHVEKNATEPSNKLNTTNSKMTSENKVDVTTEKMIKQEKETNPSNEKKSGNALENANFFDKTTLSSTESSNNGQKENSKKTSEAKDEQSNTSSTTLTSVPQKEIKDASITSSRKSGPALRKHPKSGHLSGKKQDSASLKEDRCEGDDDDNDDDEYADTCEKGTKTVCKSQTPKECSTTETPCKSTESNDDDDVCDPLEDVTGNNEPEGPCEPEEDEFDTKKAPCGTTVKVCETTEDPCKSTEEPCGTTAPPCETTKAPCDTTEPPCETTEDPCKTTEAPCDTTETPCETTEDPCKTTEEPCETTVNLCKITEEPCDTTEPPCETTEDPCKTTEAPCETTVPPCEEPTEAPCETTEAPCTTAPDPCTTPCPSSTECADEEMETDPPCQTTPVCKTASKKGNSTSEVDKGFGDRNEDQDDDDDDNEYDYENE